MIINRMTKLWIIVNFIFLCFVLMFFVLGWFWGDHWNQIFFFANILIIPLIFHIFYQGLYVGGLVSVITLGILIAQLHKLRGKNQPIPTIWVAGEIFIILVGILDVLPISFKLIGNLYYMIPGW